jgi:hypothetical protein
LGRGTIDRLEGFSSADTFIFGDKRGRFYDDGNSRAAGTADLAIILDFERGTDKIQVAGPVSSYVFSKTTVTDGIGTVSGIGVYHDTNANGRFDSRDELIGLVANVSTLGQSDLLAL